MNKNDKKTIDDKDTIGYAGNEYCISCSGVYQVCS